MVLLVHTQPESASGQRRATNLTRATDLLVYRRTTRRVPDAPIHEVGEATAELRAVFDVTTGDQTTIAQGTATEIATLFEAIIGAVARENGNPCVVLDVDRIRAEVSRERAE